MKKSNTLILMLAFLCFSMISFAQSQRMVLVEEATQASCGPCAAANPGLQALLNQNPDKAIFIAYQVWWPGVDAMYEDNPQEVNVRIGDYYSSITGAPNIVVQGNSEAQFVSYLTQEVIDQGYAEMSEFDIELTASINNTTLNIEGKITATAEASGDLRLRLVITEHLIKNEDLAFIGTNGETEFHHVFKKFVNGPEGIALSNSWAPGDTYTINESFNLGTLNIYNFSEVEVVAMIQNDDNKFIHQAAKAEDLEITVDVANNVGAVKVQGLPGNVCSGENTFVPEFQLQNGGNEDLTSATITYNVNGGDDQTFEWTGSLSTFEKDAVVLDPISFDAMTDNIVNVTVSNPNGVDDGNEEDNTISSASVPLALTGVDAFTVEILTDDYGDEVYWEVRNGAGDKVISGGNPNVGTTNINTGMFPAPPHPDMYQNNTIYTAEFTIAENDCFTFHITDYYGDGISISQTPAYYQVTDQSGLVVVYGIDESYAEITTLFMGESLAVAVEDIVDVNSVKIFPNPVTEIGYINFSLINDANARIVVSNTMGQTLITKPLGNITAGDHSEEVDMSSLTDGFYFVQIELDDEVITKKIMVME